MDQHARLKILGAVLALASSLWAQTPDSHSPSVTAVAGESWLNHLHRSFDETSMGKTGRLGPPTEESALGAVTLASAVEKEAVTLHGSDLYRWNCRGCHGESGLGAPPEINSVINPVRSSSPTLVMERMKKVGMNMSPAEAAKLAKQSHDALLERLHKGGQDMPSFSHLNDAEIRSLIAYLRELAAVPHAAAQQIAIDETPLRIGEQIVKSTCHVCHSASGPNPGAEQLAEGAIPPLSTLAKRVSKTRFIQKVTRGAPIIMGTPAFSYRGRMPVFYYLSEEEAANAYLYLTSYPPRQETTLAQAVVLPIAETTPSEPDPPGKTAKASLAPQPVTAKDQETSDMQLIAFLLVSGVLVSFLLMGAFGFTLRECMRLSASKRAQAVAAREVGAQVVHPVGGEPAADRLIA